jgi:hypothetical protein
VDAVAILPALSGYKGDPISILGHGATGFVLSVRSRLACTIVLKSLGELRIELSIYASTDDRLRPETGSVVVRYGDLIE